MKRRFIMVNNRNDNGMSREEAGQKGGETTAKTHDKEFYQDIGQKGGEATAESHGKEFYEDIGQRGGENSGGNFANDPKRASEAGKKGGENSHSGGGNNR
jgi:hypothetical protein